MSPSLDPTAARRRIWGAWLALGGALLAAALALLLASPLFAADIETVDMPALELAAGMVGAGLLFLAILPLIRATIGAGMGDSRALLAVVFALGLALRLSLFPSTPALESDWNRYLWDGAVTANGYNPYAVSPDDAQAEPHHYTLQPLAHASGTVIEQVNHPHLKTIYPPVAQAAFALSYGIKPFSLGAWRAVLLVAEIATFALLAALLVLAQRSPLWAAVYWWNPVAVKEIVNSAHMDGLVAPFALGALLLGAKARPTAAVLGACLAAGTKLWPLVLMPLLLRPLWNSKRRLAATVIMAGALLTLWALPIVLGGVDKSSGFVAFAQYWRTNSAHFPALERLAAALLSPLEVPDYAPGLIARLALAASVAGIAIWVSLRPLGGPGDLMNRAGIIVAALVLLSPVQFPWYAVWMLPFLCFRPSLALLAVLALTPAYYLSFHFMARDAHEIFRTYVVWMIWVPVWALLAREHWMSRQADQGSAQHA